LTAYAKTDDSEVNSSNHSND